MIKVTFFEDPSGSYKGYEISGHADYSEAGSDIICSAVSALGINTANSLKELVRIPLQTKTREGYLKVMLPESIPENEHHDAQLLLESLKLGLRSIQESYGSKYLQLSTF